MQNYCILHIFQENSPLRWNLHAWPECDSMNYTEQVVQTQNLCVSIQGKLLQVLYSTLFLYVCPLLHAWQYCAQEIRSLYLCWNWGKGVTELGLGELGGSNRSTWDTRTWAAGVGTCKTHQLSKRIQSGVPSLGITVERYRTQGWVYAFWLKATWKSWMKLHSRVECSSLCYN